MFDDDTAWSAAEVYEAGWVQAVVIGDLAGRVKSIKNLIAQEMAQFAIRPFLMIAVRANEDDVFLAHTGSQQLVNDNAENTLPRGGGLVGSSWPMATVMPGLIRDSRDGAPIGLAIASSTARRGSECRSGSWNSATTALCGTSIASFRAPKSTSMFFIRVSDQDTNFYVSASVA